MATAALFAATGWLALRATWGAALAVLSLCVAVSLGWQAQRRAMLPQT